MTVMYHIVCKFWWERGSGEENGFHIWPRKEVREVVEGKRPRSFFDWEKKEGVELARIVSYDNYPVCTTEWLTLLGTGSKDHLTAMRRIILDRIYAGGGYFRAASTPVH